MRRHIARSTLERSPSRPVIAALAAALLVSACSGSIPALRPGAERVAILRDRPPGEHREIAELYCRLGRNFRSLRANVDHCRVDLRNDAHARGADFVVIYIELLGRDDCRNCVYFVAHAYARSGSPRGTRRARRRREPERQPAPPRDFVTRLAAAFPGPARNAGLSGEALVRIEVSDQGDARALEIVGEAPAGQGFGEACRATLDGSTGWTPATDTRGDPVSRVTTFRCGFSLVQ